MTQQVSLWLGLFTILFLTILIILFIWSFPKFLREARLFSNAGFQGGHDDSLTEYMSELSLCDNKRRITELCDHIREENEIVLSRSPKPLQKQQAQTVLTWLEQFSIDTHINELKTKKTSSQINYNNKTKKYKLMIIR